MLCFHCKKYFATPKSFFYHYKLDHKTKDFRCGKKNCFRLFSTLKSFRKHILLHFENSGNLSFVNNRSKPIEGTPSTSSATNSCQEDKYEKEENPLPSLNNRDVPNDFSTKLKVFVAKMYDNSLVPRSFINFVLNQIDELFCKGLIHDIGNTVYRQFKKYNASDEDLSNTKNLFDAAVNSLSDFKTEYRCLTQFKNCGEYIAPSNFIIGSRLKYARKKSNNVSLVPSDVIGKIIPLRKVFTILFEKSGVYESVQDYVNEIKLSKTYVNFI